MLSTLKGFSSGARIHTYTSVAFGNRQSHVLPHTQQPLFAQYLENGPTAPVTWKFLGGAATLLLAGVISLATHGGKGLKMPHWPTQEERAIQRLEKENERFGKSKRYERSDEYWLKKDKEKIP
jgi:hypothetical protein